MKQHLFLELTKRCEKFLDVKFTKSNTVIHTMDEVFLCTPKFVGDKIIVQFRNDILITFTVSIYGNVKTIKSFYIEVKDDEMFEYNLNQNVWVKFHDDKLDVAIGKIMKYHNCGIPIAWDHLMVTEESIRVKMKDGCIPLQIWEFVKIFNDELGMGKIPSFDMNVRLEQKHVKPIKND